MKYIVQLSYTNPAHEHVSLRRRVDTVNRIVEAENENQAILRASQQQRSLGFMIKEAKIVKEKEKTKKKEVVADIEKTEVAAAGEMKEGFDPDPSDIAAHLVKKHGKGKVTKDHVDAYEKDRDSNKSIDKEAVMKHVQKMSEEVEQVDEANMRFDPEAAARPKSSDVKNFLNRDKNPRAAAASKKYIRRMTKLGGLGPNQTKKDTEAHMKAHFEEVVTEASKEGKSVMYGMRASMKAMDLRHGVDSDKRDSGYKMSPAVRAAQAKSDALSKVEKPLQAGTLAALKRREMKKEAVDPGSIKVVNKKVEAKATASTRASEKRSNAAKKAIDLAKSKKNPVNLEPVLSGDKVKNA